MFTPNGHAGVFALYGPADSNLGRGFLNEFVCVRRPRSRLGTVHLMTPR